MGEVINEEWDQQLLRMSVEWTEVIVYDHLYTRHIFEEPCHDKSRGIQTLTNRRLTKEYNDQ